VLMRYGAAAMEPPAELLAYFSSKQW